MPLGSVLRALRDRLALARMADGARPEVRGRVWAHGGGTIRFGAGVVLDASLAPIELHAESGGVIELADGVTVLGGASIWAMVSVSVGAGARVGQGSKLLDSHHHPLRGDRNQRTAAQPVEVGAGAVIGEHAIVLPGAVVPRGAVVAPGAVVRPARGAAARSPPGAPAAGRAPPPGGCALRANVQKAAALLRGAWEFRSCVREGRVYARGPVRVENRGELRIGDRAVFLDGMIPTALACAPGATLEIGARTLTNYGVSIDAAGDVRLGRNCMLASGVRITDRSPDGVRPVRIGDDVWLAHGVTVAPGVTIGDGSVVAAGSVVTRDVPPNSLAAGKPARSVRLDLAEAGGPPARGGLPAAPGGVGAAGAEWGD